MRKGGLWISQKTVNFFHGHGAWIRVFTAWISISTPVHSLREFFTLGVKLIMLRKIIEDFHAVKLRVNTFSRRETCRRWMKSNLFFLFCVFSRPFSNWKKNENTWSRQAKFVEVDPTQKKIFLSAYSSRFKYKKAYSDYSAFRPVKPQITIKLVTISCRYFYVFMASILLDMHDRNCVCFMSICIVYIICHGAFFFLLLNVQIFPMSMSETISYLPNMARFSLKKPNEILCGKTNYYCHS